MDFFELIKSIFTDYTLRTVSLGAGVLGIVSGTLGAFAVLRRQSLLGDAMSHAALPGIALAFLITGSKASLVLIIGAALAGWLGTYFIGKITGLSRIKYDSALGMVLSVFFGIGLVLLTYIQRLPNAAQAGLDKFLFGQAATLLERDVIVMCVIGLIVLKLILLFFKEFKLLSFDPEFGQSIGYPMKLIDSILTGLLVVAIVLGLQTVGVVLMSAMIVAPAAGARQWTERLSVMLILSALFGLVAGVSGAVISSTTARIPTGPTIVVAVSVIVIISLLFAPGRGLVASLFRKMRNRRRLQLELVLSNLYALASQHSSLTHPHEIAALDAMSVTDYGIRQSLRELESRGFVQCFERVRWALTEEGVVEAQKIIKTSGASDR